MTHTPRSHHQYGRITILFNPNSTGASERLALKLDKQLAAKLPGQQIEHIPTQHKGHAETLAYELAKSADRPLIISSSGDGGYHEVINGLMRASAEGANPVAGLLPAGNANDHYRDLHDINIGTAIAEQREQYVDLLRLRAKSKGKDIERYAHSYIGLGLTPEAGEKLNQARVKWLSEAWIIARVLLFLSSVRIIVDGDVRHYDSVVCSNVTKMSKILKISKTASPDDGKFEVTAFRRRNKLQLISSLIKATTIGMPNAKQTTSYTFKTLDPTLVQLDGEIITLDPDCTTTIDIVPTALRCIV